MYPSLRVPTIDASNATAMARLLTEKEKAIGSTLALKKEEISILTMARDKDFDKMLEIMNAQISMLTAANDKAIADLNAEISTLTTEKEIAIIKLKNIIIDLEKLVATLKQTVQSQKEEIACLRFNHWLKMRDIRRNFNSTVIMKLKSIKETK